MKHHDYQRGGSVMNHQPATYPQLMDLMNGKASKSTISRFLNAKFGNDGYRLYKEACMKREIGLKIAKWRDELPEDYIDRAVEGELRRQQGCD